MASTKQIVQGIIRAAANASDGIGGESAAPTPEQIRRIQTDMIKAIANEHGVSIDDAAATNLLTTFATTMQNHPVRSGRQLLVGWLPGIDNDVDDRDTTVAAVTEAIGWTANSHFEKPETQ